MISSILTLSNLEVGYSINNSSHRLLNPFSCDILPGQFISLVGPNGAGKSTLLRTIAGLQPPLKGSVVYQNKDYLKLPYKHKAAVVSLVSSHNSLKPNFTVEEYVALGRYRFSNWWGRTTDSEQQSLNRLLESFNLQHLSLRKIFDLSDGEFQRVEVARAVAQQTPLMLLDEPTSHLDYPSRIEIMSMLKNLTQTQNLTIIVSTHEIDLALKFSDEFWLTKPQSSICITSTLSNDMLNDLFNTSVF